MSDLRKNIHRYMDIKQIKYYSDLLVMIGKELKISDPYTFAEKEKSNFSKMLKEERPLKYDYIIPLERIFGVPLARLVYEGSYTLPENKEDIPFVKGFRYYAYKDDPKLYEDEFERTMITNDGYPTICNSDEFNKFFLDYVIEYRSLNALRFLYKKHNFTAVPYSRNTYIFDGRQSLFHSFDNELLKMVIREDDVELFNVVFNPYNTCLLYNTSLANLKLDLETFRLILKSDKIFKSLFIPREIPYKTLNNSIVGHDDETLVFLNPLLTQCLDVALSDLKSYREQAKEILNFGITYNKKMLNSLNIDMKDLNVEEYGKVYYRYRELLGSIVYPEFTTDDPEMCELINKLTHPKYIQRGM